MTGRLRGIRHVRQLTPVLKLLIALFKRALPGR